MRYRFLDLSSFANNSNKTRGKDKSLKKWTHKSVSNRKESKVRLHPSSALLEAADGGSNNGVGGGGKKVSSARNRNSVAQIPTDWFIFDEMVRAGHLALVRGVTAVSPATVLLFAGPNRMPVEAVTEADAAAHGNPYLEETSDSEVSNIFFYHGSMTLIECY